jgi:hypothetical protein
MADINTALDASKDAIEQLIIHACSFNHSDISPFKWKQPVTVRGQPCKTSL